MAETDHIVIAGAGAIGCFVGGQLASAGRRVTLLVRPRIAAEIRAHGLTLTDLEGQAKSITTQDLTLSEDPSALAQASVVLVTVKTRDTGDVGRLIQQHTGEEVPVISLQNGVSNAHTLREALPGRDVRAGMVPYNVVPMGQGCYHRAVEGDTVIEAGPGGLAQIIATPDMACFESAEIENVQWGKFLINLNNALNALSGLPIQQQLRDRGWRRLMADQWAEALGVLRAAGIKPISSTPVSVAMIPWILRLPTPLFKRVAAAMLKIDPQARTSMSYDLMEHRPTEIDALQGEVVRRGRDIGRATPINAMVADVVQTAELAGEGLPHLTPAALRAELEMASKGA